MISPDGQGFSTFIMIRKNDRSNVSSKVRSSSSQCRSDMQVMSNNVVYYSQRKCLLFSHLKYYNLKALLQKVFLKWRCLSATSSMSAIYEYCTLSRSSGYPKLPMSSKLRNYIKYYINGAAMR